MQTRRAEQAACRHPWLTLLTAMLISTGGSQPAQMVSRPSLSAMASPRDG